MIAIDPVNRPTTAQQVLIELQRIARSGLSKSQNSSISKNRKELRKPTKKAKHNQNRQVEQKHSKGLVIALVISFLVIIGLIAKDFI